MKSWKSTNSIKAFINNRIIKRHFYNKAVKNADSLVLYTPSTKRMLKGIVSEKYHELVDNKSLQSSLGYDPQIFYFDSNEREKKRAELQINPNDLVLITATKLAKGKGIDLIIKAVDSIHQKGIKIYYILVGKLKDPYSEYIEELINQTSHPEYFILKPFLPQEEIRKYYAASDLGIWLQAAISIQQAQGTGLTVLLKNKDSVNHLLTHGLNGYFINENHISKSISKICLDFNNRSIEEKQKTRDKNIKFNQQFNYVSIVKDLIKVCFNN
jgi:glycosyltransferase involved in cell wall biosynthesis